MTKPLSHSLISAVLAVFAGLALVGTAVGPARAAEVAPVVVAQPTR